MYLMLRYAAKDELLRLLLYLLHVLLLYTRHLVLIRLR